MLQTIDAKWKEHLHSIDDLREGIHLRAYGQRDPLVEYKHEAFSLFDELVRNVRHDALEFLFKVQAVRQEERISTALDTKSQKFLHPEQARFAAPVPDTGAIMQDPKLTGRPFGGSSGFPQDQETETKSPIRHSEPKIGRNDPCPCGSGKKYKKCHGA